MRFKSKSFPLLIVLILAASSLIVYSPALGQNQSSSAPALDWQKTLPGYVASWVGQAPSGGFAFFIPGIESYPGAAAVSNASLTKISSYGTIQWTKNFVRPFPEAIIATNDGYAYTNRSDSLTDNGPITINKLDSYGNRQWSQTLPNSYSGSALFIQTNDGGYALKVQNIIIKTDAHGITQWNKTITAFDGNYSLRSLIQTSDNGYALAGSKSSGSSGTDFCLAKLDYAGNLQWIKTFGGANDDGANSIVQTSDGGYALVGNTGSFGAGGTDALMVKTDGSGNLLWAHTYGGFGNTTTLQGQTDSGGKPIADKTMTFSNPGSGEDYANCLVQTKDGGLAFAGATQWGEFSYNMLWLVKTDANGAAEWNRTYADFESNPIYANKLRWDLSSFIQADDGSFFLGGDAVGDSFWDHSCFLVKTKPDVASSAISQPSLMSSLTFSPVIINENGSITPSTAPITREGSQYTLTSDIQNPLIIKTDNIVVNGQGHLLNGNGTLGNLFVFKSQIGVDLSSTNGVTLQNLNIQNFKIGIYFDNSTGPNISQNTLTLNNQGILGVKSANAVISENSFSGENQEGIHLTSCLNGQISNNDLLNQVTLDSSSGVIVSGNFNVSGVWLQSAQNTLICGNNLFGVVDISDSNGTIVAANNFTNTVIPIVDNGAPGNLFYMNNFINSTYLPQISVGLSDSLGNPASIKETWDNGSVGNYWSNYTQRYPDAVEVGNSGTWNIPYVINGNNTDNHPLVVPVSSDAALSLSQSLISAHVSSRASTTPFFDLNLIIVIFLITAAIVALLTITVMLRKRKQKSKLARSNPLGLT